MNGEVVNAKWCLECGREELSLRYKTCPQCGGSSFLAYHDVDALPEEVQHGEGQKAASS